MSGWPPPAVPPPASGLDVAADPGAFDPSVKSVAITSGPPVAARVLAYGLLAVPWRESPRVSVAAPAAIAMSSRNAWTG